jgi:hypothetical protein
MINRLTSEFLLPYPNNGKLRTATKRTRFSQGNIDLNLKTMLSQAIP